MPDNKQDRPVDRPRRGALGDTIPRPDDPTPTRGGQNPEEVEDRPVVGRVRPEDYPPDERAKGQP